MAIITQILTKQLLYNFFINNRPTENRFENYNMKVHVHIIQIVLCQNIKPIFLLLNSRLTLVTIRKLKSFTCCTLRFDTRNSSTHNNSTLCPNLFLQKIMRFEDNGETQIFRFLLI